MLTAIVLPLSLILAAAPARPDGLDAARQLIARDSVNESAYRMLTRCLEELGELREARRIHERLVTALRDEL